MELKKKKDNSLIIIAIGVVLYIALFVLNGRMSGGGPGRSTAGGPPETTVSQSADEGGEAQSGPPAGTTRSSSNGANGVIGQIMVVISVGLVLLAKKKGFITAAVLNGFNSLFVLFTQYIGNGNKGALPGVVVSALSIVICFIIYFYVSRTEKMNAELTESYQQAIEQAHMIEEKDESLKFLAYYDRLTEMPNRQSFIDELDERIGKNSSCTVIYCDIDDFKQINDNFGHNIGDELLIQYSDKLKEYCGDDIFAAKIGGDEYGFILGAGYNAEDVINVVNGIAGIFSTQVNIRGDVFAITASYGAATFPNDSRSSEDLFRCAETAMFTAKAQGKRQLCFYSR